MSKRVKWSGSLLVVWMVAFIFLTGCSGSNSGNKPADSAQSEKPAQQEISTSNPPETEKLGIQLDPNKKVKLRYYTPSAYDQVEFEAAYPEWQKLYPNIEVELVLVSSGDFNTSVKMATIAGEQVDVIYTGTTNLERSNPGSLYVPLDDFIKKDGWDLNAEFGDYKDQLMIDGKLYGIPRAIAPDGVWYNKKLFQEQGIPDPSSGDWTWKEFFQIAKKLTKLDEKGNSMRYGIQDWTFQTGNLATSTLNLALYAGWEMIKGDGSFNTDWEPYKEAVQLMYNAVYVDKSMASPADIAAKGLHWQNDYYSGVNAMGIGGRNGALFQDLAVEYGQLTHEDDDAGIHTLAPMPRWDGSSPKKQALSTIVSDSISKLSKNPDEAYMFIKWHATKSIEIASKVAHRIPASSKLDKAALMNNWRYYNNKDGKLVQGKQRDELYNRMLDPEIKTIYFQNSVKYSYSAKMKAELEKHLSKLFANEIKVDEMIDSAKIATFNIYEEESK
ncbi:ABC transporter substrate-binding protein [Paenibacillus eucommiae]|uniref:ABC-type glycerol-3-phosphate transport system substrate-binding protein n=1 Tax=Paenibacillus eucommiae TaxID=1355755 RepID=A0ABS4ISZ2_9BACL|nr:extracellular solute-binding protein [Paenibacillus eucommiae]MBP1990250.1 ABC-type glycerol-3-phosphate transport system substrate-binding protein [Paenibacillus eucommiae]